MKTTLMTIALTLAVALPTARASQLLPEIVTLTPDRGFVPPGFDDNDNAQVVVIGRLHNTCFKMGPASARVDYSQHKVIVTAQSYYYSSGWCLQILVPYTQVIDVGLLPAGDYSVVAATDDGREMPLGSLPIAVAKTASPDDQLYAPVLDARVDVGQQPGTYDLTLEGSFPSPCMTIKKVTVMSRAQGVVEVLPIADFKSGETCKSDPHPFKEHVTFKTPWKMPFLVHIRSLNGKSVNKIMEGLL